MRRQDFHYDLPSERIARYPIEPRSAARLLHLGTDGLHDRAMLDFPALLAPGDLVVFNDTRVIKARLHGSKPTGGRAEVLIERVLSGQEVLAQLGVSKKPKLGGRILVADGSLVLLGREDDLFHFRWEGPGDVWALMERAGELPLPPYFEREPNAEDESRYQTLFAEKPGAVAAPTASLHFDETLLAALAARQVRTARVTLHVGAGTFQPVRVDELSEHQMHSEYYEVSAETAALIAETKARAGRVVAVGTTVCRALESAARSGTLVAGAGDTRLFITPGYRFAVVDRLLTNFHLPESTLLMLVCAFGGYSRLMAAYQHAIAAEYRFFSYGDAMLIERARGG
ncbi:MAG: tRNA preQ1(34) S-adenosylmethionine ribosyltransferase-isomerase QueA [Nevskiaceae bacterium]|nr:MAG: tRNA preQ1(34) S-adenosylmethionine ribosyltransferase-isomerase QueA [Nevskiaceae bacterium]